MNIQFATCVRSTALEYLQRVLPDKVIADTQESAKDLLDLVEKDIVRVQDPMMYGKRIGIVPSKNFTESDREKVIEACKKIT